MSNLVGLMQNLPKTEIFILSYAEIREGSVEIRKVAWSDIPDNVRDKLWPEWNHPSGCECHPCWQQKELGK